MGTCRVCGKSAGVFRKVHKRCADAGRSVAGEGPIQEAIAGLIRQRSTQEAIGERSEAMLIPHKRIKLDIMIKAYQKDLHDAISRLRREGLPEPELLGEVRRMEGEVSSLIYNLKRERREHIEAIFEDMKAARADLHELELEVRAENPLYRIVPSDELGLDK